MSKERFRQHLLSDTFRSNIAKLGAFSIKTGAEGGIFVYRNGRQVLDRPKLSTSRQHAEDIEDIHDSIKHGYGTYNPRNGDIASRRSSKELRERGIAPDSDKAWKPRSDIDIFIHSHPLGDQNLEVGKRSQLRPSLTDLDSWEKINHSSPGFTDGVLVSSETSSDLLLWRHDPDKQIIPYYQQLEPLSAASRVVRVMRESGLYVAMVDMTLSGDAYTKQIESTAEQLFSPSE